MESQRGGKQNADQLQGTTWKDQGVRSRPAGELNSIHLLESNHEAPNADMAVIRSADSLLRCYVSAEQWDDLDLGSKDFIAIRGEEPGSEELIPLKDAKAIFFVKTFAGTPDHQDLRFHDHLSPAKLLWVRITFLDGETMEGTIENSQDHVLNRGFMLKPVDPDSNNRLIYVLKDKLSSFQVLATRSAKPVTHVTL